MIHSDEGQNAAGSASAANTAAERGRIQSNQNRVTTSYTLDANERIPEEDPKNDETLSIDKAAEKPPSDGRIEDSIENIEGYKVADGGSLVLVANTAEM